MIAPVADRVESPVCQTAEHETVELIPIIRAVLPPQVCRGESEATILSTALTREKFLQSRTAGQQVGAPNRVETTGEEQPSFRIDQPPFPLIFFRPEKSGRLQLRPFRPAAVTVPPGDRSAQPPGLLPETAPELFIGMDLLRPLPVNILSIPVDAGEETLRGGHFGRHFRTP